MSIRYSHCFPAAANVAGAICVQAASGSSAPAGTAATSPTAKSNVTVASTPAVVSTGPGATNEARVIVAGAAFLAAALL
jgi:hypothetical protein